MGAWLSLAEGKLKRVSIRKRLVGSYFIVIFITVLILELFLIVSVHVYYNRNIERIVMNQAELSASFYEQYFADEPLADQSERMLRGFAQRTTAQVQIIAANGLLLQDSVGVPGSQEMGLFEDVAAALRGEPGQWNGIDTTTGEPIMAVSLPLKSEETIAGVVRIVTSMTETISTVRQISLIFIIAGLVVVAVVTLLSVLLSRTITGPITELTVAARQLTEGRDAAKVKKTFNDELGTLSDTFNTMAVTIRENEQLKNDFISSVSHELRTPLTSIKGWAVTLKAESGGQDRQLLLDGLDIMEQESDRLTKLVDELLDFARLENGRISLHPAPLKLEELLSYVVKQLAPRAHRQSISLELLAASTLPPIVADEHRLKQVLINLLDNALKFTEPGGTITVTAQHEQGQFIIKVADTGVGIAEGELPRIVRKFYTGSGGAGGSGLGLSICDQIVRLHGGSMTIQSELGRGTCVILTFS